MVIFNKDLVENFKNNNMREKLMELVDIHKTILIKDLSSSQRHIIYRQMYYPLKFEKIINENEEKNIDIKIYNGKIKKKENNKINKEKTGKTEEEYILEDSEQSDEESTSDSEYESESEDSYLTDEDEQLTRVEDIGSQILEKTIKSEKKIDRSITRLNFIIILNIICCIIVYTLDNIEVSYIKKTECGVY